MGRFLLRGGYAGDSEREVGLRGFGELESAVMQHLWAAEGGATVREVYEQMRQSRQIAYPTVLSTIHNLHGRAA